MTSDSRGREMRMSLPEFAALLSRFGAAPARWPEASRARAAALLADSAEARAMQAEEAALDRVLAQSDVPPPPSSLRDAILAAAPRPAARRQGGGFWPELLATLGGWRPAGAALAASLALGIASGGALSDQPGDGIGASIVQLALFDDNFAEY